MVPALYTQVIIWKATLFINLFQTLLV